MKLTLFALLFLALLFTGSASAQDICTCANGIQYVCDSNYACGIGPGTLNCPGDCGCPINPSDAPLPNCTPSGNAVVSSGSTAKNFTPIPPAMRKPEQLTAHGPVMPPPDCSYEWNCACGCNAAGTGCFYGPYLQKQIVLKPTAEQLAKLREASLSAIQKTAPNCHAIAGVKLTAHGPVMPPPDNPPGNDPCVCWNDINYLACALGYLTPCW